MRSGRFRQQQTEDDVDSIGRVIDWLVREHVQRAVREYLPQLIDEALRLQRLAPPTSGQSHDEYLTRREAARIAKLSPRTIARYIEAGKLRPSGPRRDRVTRSELDRFLQAEGVEEATELGQESEDDGMSREVDRLMGRTK